MGDRPAMLCCELDRSLLNRKFDWIGPHYARRLGGALSNSHSSILRVPSKLFAFESFRDQKLGFGTIDGCEKVLARIYG